MLKPFIGTCLVRDKLGEVSSSRACAFAFQSVQELPSGRAIIDGLTVMQVLVPDLVNDAIVPSLIELSPERSALLGDCVSSASIAGNQ